MKLLIPLLAILITGCATNSVKSSSQIKSPYPHIPHGNEWLDTPDEMTKTTECIEGSVFHIVRRTYLEEGVGIKIAFEERDINNNPVQCTEL
jgi:hypothetical protein